MKVRRLVPPQAQPQTPRSPRDDFVHQTVSTRIYARPFASRACAAGLIEPSVDGVPLAQRHDNISTAKINDSRGTAHVFPSPSCRIGLVEPSREGVPIGSPGEVALGPRAARTRDEACSFPAAVYPSGLMDSRTEVLQSVARANLLAGPLRCRHSRRPTASPPSRTLVYPNPTSMVFRSRWRATTLTRRRVERRGRRLTRGFRPLTGRRSWNPRTKEYLLLVVRATIPVRDPDKRIAVSSFTSTLLSGAADTVHCQSTSSSL